MAETAAGGDADETNIVLKTMCRREESLYQLMNNRLGEVDYLAGDALSCADFMAMFPLTSLAGNGGRQIDDLPHIKAYVQRVAQRPAYQKAMAIAGPTASRPAD